MNKTTDKQIEALKLALEALKELRMLGMNMQWHDSWLAKSETAITTIREALAEQPAQQQEPVAWRTKNATPPGGYVVFQQYPQALADLGVEIEPLYTSPQPRKPWAGLTNEEKMAALVSVDAETKRLPPGFRDFANAIEAKLKEKNNG